MATYAVNVTDFSRGLSEFLNNVQYKGMVLDIERGKRVVAVYHLRGWWTGFLLGSWMICWARGRSYRLLTGSRWPKTCVPYALSCAPRLTHGLSD